MEKNYPMIYIYGDSAKGNTSEDAKVRLAFGRERKEPDRGQEADWVCKMVRTAQAPLCAAILTQPVQHQQLFH